MKNLKNGIIILVVVINLQDELVHLKKTYWILSQQCDHPVIVPLVPEVVPRKMVCRNKDMHHREVVLSDPLTTLTFTLDKYVFNHLLFNRRFINFLLKK